MLILIKVLTWCASPTGVFIWGNILGGLSALVHWRKTARFLWVISSLQLAIFALPITAEKLLGQLEEQARQLEQHNQKAQRLLSGQRYAAILLLGGATSPASPPQRPHPDLGSAADRMWHAARLYKEGLATKIIVSGGRSPGLEARSDLQTEAQGMRLFLIDLGIPEHVMILEDQARTTRENANFAKTIVGSDHVALVTSAFHMPRAFENFRQAGLLVDAYPTDFEVAPESIAPWARVFPNGGSLERSEIAIKEYIALLFKY